MKATLPHLLGDLLHSNQFLKIFCFCLSGISILSLTVGLMLAMKAPVVVTLSPSAELLEQRGTPKIEDEVRAAIRGYIELRYKWDATNASAHLKAAEGFISSESLRPYRTATSNIARFVAEKTASQKVYARRIDVDADKKLVKILGDRITEIQGLKAAGELRLELIYESGPRTKFNPWGIYILKEKEG